MNRESAHLAEPVGQEVEEDDAPRAVFAGDEPTAGFGAKARVELAQVRRRVGAGGAAVDDADVDLAGGGVDEHGNGRAREGRLAAAGYRA